MVKHCTHVGKRAQRNHGCHIPSGTMTRTVALPQGTNTQLNTPAAPGNTLSMPQGCTHCLWDYDTEISNTLPSRFCLLNT